MDRDLGPRPSHTDALDGELVLQISVKEQQELTAGTRSLPAPRRQALHNPGRLETLASPSESQGAQMLPSTSAATA